MKNSKLLVVIAIISLIIASLALVGCGSSNPSYSGASLDKAGASTVVGGSSENVIGAAADKASSEAAAAEAAAAEAAAAEAAAAEAAATEAAAANAANAAATAVPNNTGAGSTSGGAGSQVDDGCLTDVAVG